MKWVTLRKVQCLKRGLRVFVLVMGGLMGFSGVLIREIPCKVSSFPFLISAFLVIDLLLFLWNLGTFFAFNACEGL